jgi:hypothetical protein
MPYIDLSIPRFDEWLKLIFDHEVPPDERADAWYQARNLDVSIPDKLAFVLHSTRLFREINYIAQSYSLEQIDQGVWLLLGPIGDLGSHLMEEQIAISARTACIASMSQVYSELVAALRPEVEVPTGFYMWWDLLCDSFWGSVRQRVTSLRNVPDRYALTSDDLIQSESVIQESMLTCLKEILMIDDLRSQSCALHGMGHLRHPKCRQVVQSYIDARRNQLDEHQLRWLQQCRDGAVL